MTSSILKYSCFIILILDLFNYGYSQTASLENNRPKIAKLYLSCGGIGYNEVNVVGLNSTFILSNDWGGSISYQQSFLRTRNIPDDYSPGLCLFDCSQLDYTRVLALKILKEFPISTKLIRFGIESGPSWVEYYFARFRPGNFSGGGSSNYTLYYDVKNTVGLVLKAKVEFPLTRFAGLELAAMVNINEFKSFIGMEINWTLGVVRARIKPSKKMTISG